AGVRAAALNSRLSPGETAEIERAVRDGALDLVYVSRERLVTPRCLELLSHCHLGLFAVDEAHCISQWGHHFRPEYQQLSILRALFPRGPSWPPPATAPARPRRAIVPQLQLADARFFPAGYDRPNFFYRVAPKHNPLKQLWRFPTEEPPADAGIIYC